ncbi:MAG: hypothetical protein AAB590_00585 [Patescibacteria group bacterium]
MSKKVKNLLKLALILTVTLSATFGITKSISATSHYSNIVDIVTSQPAQPQVTQDQPYYKTKAALEHAAGTASESCGGGWFDMSVSCVIVNALAWLVTQWIWLLGQALRLVSWLFDYTLQISIVQFGALVNKGFVVEGWRIIRDICNMGFIFILLWIAIKTILGLGSNTKNAIINVIIAALLINFSFSIGKVVIDAGNVLALTFYNSAKDCPKGCDGTLATRVINSLQMVQASGLGSDPTAKARLVVGTGGAREVNKLSVSGNLAGLGFMGIVTQAVGGSLFILITIFIIAVAAFLFLRRMLYLIFLLIVSPWPFLTYAFSGSFGAWWTTLVQQSFFASAYMALFYVSVTVLGRVGPATFQEQAGNYAGGAWIGQIVFFIMASGLMFASLIAANKIADTGGAKAASWGQDKLKSWGQGSATWLGRNSLNRTVGQSGMALKSVGAKLAEKQGVLGVAGRLGMRAGTGIASSSFGMKDSNKGGLLGQREAATKAKEAIHKDLGKTDETEIQRQAILRAKTDIPQAIATAQARATADRDAELAREAQKKRIPTQAFRESAEGQTITAKYTPQAIAARITQERQSQIKKEIEKEEGAKAKTRQTSYATSLTTGPLPGWTQNRPQGSRFAPASSYLALSRIGRETKSSEDRKERIKLISSRLDELKKERDKTPAPAEDRKQQIEREIYQLEGQLLTANDSEAAAKARAAAATPKT